MDLLDRSTYGDGGKLTVQHTEMRGVLSVQTCERTPLTDQSEREGVLSGALGLRPERLVWMLDGWSGVTTAPIVFRPSRS